MDKRVESGREFWRAVLLAGGATAIPRPRTRRRNRAVSLEDIAAQPILADLAELLHRERAPELLTSSSGRN